MPVCDTICRSSGCRNIALMGAGMAPTRWQAQKARAMIGLLGR